MSDSKHLSDLYREHRPWLHSWLYRRLGCSESAADLVQDTFLRLLAKRSVPELTQPRAYLTTIAHGLFVNLLRRRQLEQAYLEALASLPQAVAPSAEERWQVLQSIQAIDTMLHGLPRKVREAFLLHQLEGLKHRQIAETLGVSQSSVRQYIARALLHCMAVIDPQT
ncbi:sigma-70 family RNA polymerase sigma factor [Azomonas macrocytogenes]|uniref:RNA polymerase sigma-70 factor (ECF subfamily) n=1 Tax=Azomonas macrocytogenes TaxID=69962 RepID=A0A839T2K6_AZOMA|nr:sigma-70 family RNA polymerase sigma factor [Azomonas macrocytogenes]MBB3102195.1 RNA polymerase sigma-70 factor (ECF subfamily) [Azomonas macrocytogenes]